MSWPREPASTRILGAVVVAPMNLKRVAWIMLFVRVFGDVHELSSLWN